MHCIYALSWIFCESSPCKWLRYFLDSINAVQTRGKKSQKAAIAHFQKFMKHWQRGIRCHAYNWSTFIFYLPEGRFFTYDLGLYYIFSFLLIYLILVLHSTSLRAYFCQLCQLFALLPNIVCFFACFCFWRSIETRKTSRFTCFCFFEEGEWEKRLLTIKDRHLLWLAFKGGAWAGGGGLMGKLGYLNLTYFNKKNL